VAALPLLAGLDGAAYADPDLLLPAYRTAMAVCAALLVLGGLLALATVRTPRAEPASAAPAAHHHHCAVDGPAMETCPHDGPLVRDADGVSRVR